MKKTIILFGLLSSMFSCISQPPKSDNNERLTYFSFDHHNSMARFNGENYKVSIEKDGRIHVIIDESFPKEKEFYLEDTSIFDELKVIVDKYKMDKYKSDYKPRHKIFDGDSWSLSYKYDSGRSVYSGGYMAWPNNYREARQAISEYFQKWRDYPIQAKEINFFQYTCTNKQGRDIEYRLERGEQEAKLFIRNAEYDTDKEVALSNDYLTELQELVNMYRLKNESSRTTDDDSASVFRYLVGYNTGDTLDIAGYYTTFLSGKGRAFQSFFSRWLPVRGNVIGFQYQKRVTDFREIKYYVTKEDEGFSLSYYDERGQRREVKMDKEDVSKLQKLVESFGLDKAKDEFMGNSTWHLFTDYDSGDLLRLGGQDDDEASKEKAQHIFDTLTEFFAPYLQ